MKKHFKILFFDMEFANGKVPGSVYSFGAVLTDEKFREKMPATDLLINPDCAWNHYVIHRILAYPMKQVKSSPKFPKVYRKIRRLFARADIAVGFAVRNDVNALNKACERYALQPIPFRYFDMEKLCKTLGDHPDAHGLSGFVNAYCGKIPKNQHRSDGDAYATMLLLQAVAESFGGDLNLLFDTFSACGAQNGESLSVWQNFVRSLMPGLFQSKKKEKSVKKEKSTAKVLDKKIIL